MASFAGSIQQLVRLFLRGAFSRMSREPGEVELVVKGFRGHLLKGITPPSAQRSQIIENISSGSIAVASAMMFA